MGICLRSILLLFTFGLALNASAKVERLFNSCALAVSSPEEVALAYRKILNHALSVASNKEKVLERFSKMAANKQPMLFEATEPELVPVAEALKKISEKSLIDETKAREILEDVLTQNQRILGQSLKNSPLLKFMKAQMTKLEADGPYHATAFGEKYGFLSTYVKGADLQDVRVVDLKTGKFMSVVSLPARAGTIRQIVDAPAINAYVTLGRQIVNGDKANRLHLVSYGGNVLHSFELPHGDSDHDLEIRLLSVDDNGETARFFILDENKTRESGREVVRDLSLSTGEWLPNEVHVNFPFKMGSEGVVETSPDRNFLMIKGRSSSDLKAFRLIQDGQYEDLKLNLQGGLPVFSGDSKMICWARGNWINVMRLNPGAELESLMNLHGILPGFEATKVAITPDGKTLIVAESVGTIRWAAIDLETKTVRVEETIALPKDRHWTVNELVPLADSKGFIMIDGGESRVYRFE